MSPSALRTVCSRYRPPFCATPPAWASATIGWIGLRREVQAVRLLGTVRSSLLPGDERVNAAQSTTAGSSESPAAAKDAYAAAIAALDRQGETVNEQPPACPHLSRLTRRICPSRRSSAPGLPSAPSGLLQRPGHGARRRLGGPEPLTVILAVAGAPRPGGPGHLPAPGSAGNVRHLTYARPSARPRLEIMPGVARYERPVATTRRWCTRPVAACGAGPSRGGSPTRRPSN